MVQVLNTRRTDMVQCPGLFYETLEDRMESPRVRTHEMKNDPLVALAQNPELTDMVTATRRLGGDPMASCRNLCFGARTVPATSCSVFPYYMGTL